ncbi:MAG: four helix bundle protein [Kofleriaceae bacterium]|nr:four helix bundle protein [Kofleriaceae bacterium]
MDARSSDSIGLNLGEGRHRRGGDRGHAYRIAHGSAGELTVALRQARARRLITEQQYADVDRILDQLRAILWRLTH